MVLADQTKTPVLLSALLLGLLLPLLLPLLARMLLSCLLSWARRLSAAACEACTSANMAEMDACFRAITCTQHSMQRQRTMLSIKNSISFAQCQP
jgi:hypothetical protein